MLGATINEMLGATIDEMLCSRRRSRREMLGATIDALSGYALSSYTLSGYTLSGYALSTSVAGLPCPRALLRWLNVKKTVFLT